MSDLGDDGLAVRLPGSQVPTIGLPSTLGESFSVATVPRGFQRLVVYAYPLIPLPGLDMPPSWGETPGARGCTVESCRFRDRADQLAMAGAAVVGLSTESTAYQQLAAAHLRLPFPLLSDAELTLTRTLRLPTFTADLPRSRPAGVQTTLLKRLTLLIRAGVIETVFCPVFRADQHADEVLEWARRHAIQE